MFYSSLLLALLSQVPGAPIQEEPPGADPAYDQGPLTVEFVAMREMRLRTNDPDLAARMQPDLRMQFRVQGERLSKISRYGNLVLTELVDDTGQSLIDPEALKDLDADTTRVNTFGAERLRTNGLLVTTRHEPAARAAHVLSKVRGEIRLIIADETEQLTIDDPFQFLGGKIEHPRLAELGIELEVMPAEQFDNSPPADRCLLLHHLAKAEHVRKVSFADGWMRPLRARAGSLTSRSGVKCQSHYFDAGPLTNELQLVLEIHPTIEDVRLELNLDGLELP